MIEKYLKVLQKVDHDSKNARHLEIITDAMCSVFRAQKDLPASVPGLGHLHKIVPAMKRAHPEMQASLLRVLNELCEADVCIRTLASFDSVSYIKMAMAGAERSAMAAAMEMISKMYEGNQSALVAQALRCELPQYLLSQLKAPLDTIEHAAAAKAHCVKGLKAMTKDLTHGMTVSDILDATDWWKTYKEQRHDLFITQSTTAGYLTGPTAGVAGYLMAAPVTAASATAPPEEDEPQQRSRLADLLGDDDD